MWDLKEMQIRMAEKHLETTKLTELQRDALSDLLSLWEMTDVIEKWVVQTETKTSQCDDKYKSIYGGTLVSHIGDKDDLCVLGVRDASYHTVDQYMVK